jgi:hypothetical protein
MRFFKRTVPILVVVLFATLAISACRPKGTVWSRPIEFIDGYKLNEPFRVPARGTYYLAIGYGKDSHLGPKGENPVDRFSVTFSIKRGSSAIKEATLVDPSGLVIFRENYTIRALYGFEGQPGNRYDLFLQIRNPAPELASTRPSALILAGP